MTRILSFTKIENTLVPKFRDSMAQAESTADVRKFFVYAMLELLNNALEEDAELTYEDVALAPKDTPGYTVSQRLRERPAFQKAMTTSDLPAILDRFAVTAINRFRRLEKNPEKTESKVYHGTGGPARS